MMVDVVVVLLSALASISIVGRAATSGLLNGALTRTVAGAGTAFATQEWLYGYTNLDSYVNACLDGTLGLPGFAFVAAILITAGVWINNVIQYRQAII